MHVFRKLKNRVAAQTARDRKKARMETLEDAVSKIHDQVCTGILQNYVLYCHVVYVCGLMALITITFDVSCRHVVAQSLKIYLFSDEQTYGCEHSINEEDTRFRRGKYGSSSKTGPGVS